MPKVEELSLLSLTKATTRVDSITHFTLSRFDCQFANTRSQRASRDLGHVSVQSSATVLASLSANESRWPMTLVNFVRRKNGIHHRGK